MEKEHNLAEIWLNSNFDPLDPVPLYHQVYTFLKKVIMGGYFKNGDQLPPEIELASTLKVSRQTVRRVMALLVNEGFIVRYSGKGTFISLNNPRNKFFLDKSFSQQMADLGMETNAKVLEKTQGIIDETSSIFLISKIGSPYFKLTRLRFGDGEPISLQTTLVVTEHCRDLNTYDFSQQSLYHLLTDEYKLEIAEILDNINAVLADEHLSNILQVDVGAPLLREQSVTFLASGDPIETTTSYFRTDRYEYTMRLKYKKENSIWQSLQR
jgi:GntR family transcriptional regulator